MRFDSSFFRCIQSSSIVKPGSRTTGPLFEKDFDHCNLKDGILLGPTHFVYILLLLISIAATQ